MIIQITTLHVDHRSTDEFKAALPEVLGIIRGADGHIAHHLDQSADDPCRYVLMVHWQGKDQAINRFQESGRLKEMRYLLHGFYDELPKTNYFSESDLAFIKKPAIKTSEEVRCEPSVAGLVC
jgi:heme-degrading monooxygenase HmoA